MLDIKKAKVIVNISPANPPLMMRTTVITDADSINNERATAAGIKNIIEEVQHYTPGYQSSISLRKLGPKAMCQVIVSGCGHYLPTYAGNLDIINCAALEVVKSL